MKKVSKQRYFYRHKVKENFTYFQQQQVVSYEEELRLEQEEIVKRNEGLMHAFIGGLNFQTSAKKVALYLTEVLGREGIRDSRIEKIELIKHSDTNRSKGYGFLTIKNRESYLKLLSLSERKLLQLEGRTIQVKPSKKQIVYDHRNLPPLDHIPNIQLQIGNFSDSIRSTILVQFECNATDLFLVSEQMKLFELIFDFNKGKYKISLT